MVLSNFTPSTVIPQLGATPVFPVKWNAKTPLTQRGFLDASADPHQIEQWQLEFPGCNWGAPTDSAFIVLDLDAKHPESFEWWREQQNIHGPVKTLEVSTPSTGLHLYFLPAAVTLKSTASQIAPGVDTRASGGYIVIPPSSIDGNSYSVINDVPIAEIPAWLLEVWPKVGERRQREHSPEIARVNTPVGDWPNTPLPSGQRNTGLASIAGWIWNRPDVILPVLEAELVYANTRLCSPPLEQSEVLAIAASISRYPKDSGRVKELADDFLSWGELQAAVTDNPGAGYFKEGADGPRRRFPDHTDRGAIAALRTRLNPIFLENLLLEGNQVGYDRAVRCGELQARQCKKCGAVQCDSHLSRYCCKQRMCPRCLGSQSRKPLWKKRDVLESEENLTIYLTCLGSYYAGDTPNQWCEGSKQIINMAYKWLSRLIRLKGCPESVKHSFSGFRADLHKGFLTIDLVLLGPASFGATVFLREYFQQASEREIDIEVYPCHTVDEGIDTFGNLLSSAFCYSNHEECQSLIQAFKGRRLVQPRGRFQERSAKSECKDDSNNSTGLLETTLHRNSVPPDDDTPQVCHECGGETTSVGRRAGNWKKVTGQYSGQLFWRLMDDPPPVRRV